MKNINEKIIKNIKERMENLDKNTVLKKAKKVITITLSCAIVLGGIGAFAGYSYIKSNIKYTQNICEKIALEKVPGDVIKTEKDINKDSLSLTYEFKIKAKDNVLNKVEVDSKSGAIIKIANSDYRDNNYHQKN